MPQLNSGSVLDCQPGAKLSEHLHHPIVLILHPTPEDGGYKEGDNPRGKHCPYLFIPSSRQRTALAALLPQTPASTSSLFTSALSSFNPLILAHHPGSQLPLASHGDLALLPFPRLPASSSSQETPLSRYAPEQQQLTTFGAVSEHLH